MENPLIFEALSAVLEKVEAVKKERKERGAAYAWRSLDDILNHVHDLFREEKVRIRTNVVSSARETIKAKQNKQLFKTVVRVTFTFVARDGSSEEHTMEGESLVADGNGTGAAIKLALKTCLEVMLTLKTGEDFGSIGLNDNNAAATLEDALDAIRAALSHEEATEAFHDFPEFHDLKEFQEKAAEIFKTKGFTK